MTSGKGKIDAMSVHGSLRVWSTVNALGPRPFSVLPGSDGREAYGLVLQNEDGSVYRPSAWVRFRVWLRRLAGRISAFVRNECPSCGRERARGPICGVCRLERHLASKAEPAEVLIDGPGLNMMTNAGMVEVRDIEPGETKRVVIDGKVFNVRRRMGPK